jgi:hypothetical protein
MQNRRSCERRIYDRDTEIGKKHGLSRSFADGLRNAGRIAMGRETDAASQRIRRYASRPCRGFHHTVPGGRLSRPGYRRRALSASYESRAFLPSTCCRRVSTGAIILFLMPFGAWFLGLTASGKNYSGSEADLKPPQPEGPSTRAPQWRTANKHQTRGWTL